MRKSTPDDKFIAEGKYVFVVDKGKKVMIDDVEFTFDKKIVFRAGDDLGYPHYHSLTEEQERLLERECPEIYYGIWGYS